MIVFDGYIYGEAEKHFFKKLRHYGLVAFYIGMLIFLPFFIIFTIAINSWMFLLLYCFTLTFIPLFFLIPINCPKDKMSLLPKKVILRDDEIICVTKTRTEIKTLCDVKAVYDYGEFYEIAFPFGKISEKFICQKSLLSQGSLDDFEEIFSEVLIKKN